MKKKLITLCLSLIAISGIAQVDIKSKNYKIEDFDRIVTNGGGNLNIKYSAKPTLEVKAANDCLELVGISVSAKTLYIEINNPKENTCNCAIEVGVPAIHELVLNGGGNTVLEKGFSPTSSFECILKGGGNVDLSELSVDSFHASIESGGKILLTARKKLEGNISGGGMIEYLGDPTVTSHVSGGGTLRKQ